MNLGAKWPVPIRLLDAGWIQIGANMITSAFVFYLITRLAYFECCINSDRCQTGNCSLNSWLLITRLYSLFRHVIMSFAKRNMEFELLLMFCWWMWFSCCTLISLDWIFVVVVVVAVAVAVWSLGFGVEPNMNLKSSHLPRSGRAALLRWPKLCHYLAGDH